MPTLHAYDDGDYLAIGPAAQAVGVSIETMRRWAKTGHVRSSRPGSGRFPPRRFKVADLRALTEKAGPSDEMADTG